MSKWKRLLALALVLSSMLLITAIAAPETTVNKWQLRAEKLGVLYEFTEYSSGNVTVHIKDLETGMVQDVVQKRNHKVFLNGVPVELMSFSSAPSAGSHAAVLPTQNSIMVSGVTWGPWSAWQSTSIRLYGSNIVEKFAAFLAEHAPSVPGKTIIYLLGLIGSCDTVKITWRMRWGEKGNYEYYERQTKIYADGKQVGGVYTDTGVSGGNGVKTVLPSLQ